MSKYTYKILAQSSYCFKSYLIVLFDWFK